MVAAQPTVLHLSDATLRRKLEGLAVLFGVSGDGLGHPNGQASEQPDGQTNGKPGGQPTELVQSTEPGEANTPGQANELGRLLRSAPRLLTNSIDSLSDNLAALQAQLPEADAASLARNAPTLLLASTQRSVVPKVALLRASLSQAELEKLCAAGMGRALGCSVEVLQRLDFLRDHHPAARASFSPLTLLLMSKDKFGTNFPATPATSDAADADATSTYANADGAATAARLRGGAAPPAVPSAAAAAAAAAAANAAADAHAAAVATAVSAATAAAATADAEDAVAFEQLAEDFGVFRRVVLRRPAATTGDGVAVAGGGERGLFCSVAVRAGEPLLVVPWQLCLVDAATVNDAALASPYEVEPAAARDTRLAAALLTALGLGDDAESAEAAGGAEAAAAEGPSTEGGTEGTTDGSVWGRLGVPGPGVEAADARRRLWRAWAGRMLPRPADGDHLPCLDDEALAALHDGALMGPSPNPSPNPNRNLDPNLNPNHHPNHHPNPNPNPNQAR